MKTAIKELKKIYNTDYKDLSSFAEKARLLQSIWRVEKGFKFEKYGNFLKEDFAKETGSNFLSKNIFGIVKTEVKNKYIDGKVIKEPRIWNNLLSILDYRRNAHTQGRSYRFCKWYALDPV